MKVALIILLGTLYGSPALAAHAPRGAGYHEALAAHREARRIALHQRLEERRERSAARQVAYFSRLYGYRVGRWAPLVGRYFPRSELRNALYCISRESGGDPNAYNHSSGATGLFQLVGYPFDVFPPKVNVHMAFHLWQSRGWSPWVVM